jgi:transcriptional regulator with XRE-family HTH domain
LIRDHPVTIFLPLDMEGMIALAHKQDFAQYLRNARIKRRLSVAQVAELIGVSTASIYFWETDRGRPRYANLSALCKVLKLPIRATREMAAG